MKTEQIICTDDIDGTKGAETVTFALDGVAYTIDLVEANHVKLTQALAPFIENATRIGKYGAGPSFKPSIATVRSHRPGRNDPALVGRIKAWAKDNGIHTPARGRIPKTVTEQYTAAGGR
jgi:hypothetical protein